MKIRLGVLVISTLFFCCSSKLEREEYIAWVQDYQHGLHIQKTFSEFVFDLQYQPSQYVQLSRQDPQKAISGSDLQYYVLNISVLDAKHDIINYNIQDAKDKQYRLYYYAYQFQQDIYLEEGGTKLPCVLFHFEQSVDMKKSRTFVLGFENPHENTEEAKLVIDSDKFSSLPIKIKISKQDIPTLKI